MTTDELDALAETVKQCHETLTQIPWWPRWGGEPGYIYSSGANKQIADLPAEMSDADPRHDSIAICDIRNALPRILAALTQAKLDWEEVERLKGILKQTCEDQCQTEESIQADCERVGVVRQTSPECVEPIEDLVARLRAENERLSNSIIGMATSAEGIDAIRFLSVAEMSVALSMRSKRDIEAENERLAKGLMRLKGNVCGWDKQQIHDEIVLLLAVRPAAAKEGMQVGGVHYDPAPDHDQPPGSQRP